MSLRLSPEAHGTLRALAYSRQARGVEPRIAKELASNGFAEYRGRMLVVTDLGRAAVSPDL
jgi:hypothetical protein